MSEAKGVSVVERECVVDTQERSDTARPRPWEVERLLDAARCHPLGIGFLLEGDLGAVAIIFRVHAFTVEAARLACRGNALQAKGV